MIEETALVIDVNEHQVLLQTQRQSACHSCSVKSGCGTSALSKVVGNRSSQFSVDKIFDVKTGDKVIVAIDENALVQGSLLIYLLPIVFMLLLAMLAEFIFVTELITVLAAVSGFVLALFVVRFLFSENHFKNKIQPHLVRRIN